MPINARSLTGIIAQPSGLCLTYSQSSARLSTQLDADYGRPVGYSQIDLQAQFLFSGSDAHRSKTTRQDAGQKSDAGRSLSLIPTRFARVAKGLCHTPKALITTLRR